jgi:glucose/mannose transport system substrate-binding protein
LILWDCRLIKGGVLLLLLGAARADEQLDANVIHSWTSGGEAAAVKVLAEDFNSRGGRWIDTAIAGFDNADAVAISRIIAGDPPTAKMFVAGPLISNLIDKKLLNNIDDTYARSGAREHTALAITQAITVDGHVYAAPLDVHGHWIYYSMSVLRKSGISQLPESWDAFFADLDKIRAAGFIPIAWGGQSWQEFKVFDSVLLTQLGITNYVKAYRYKELAVLRSPQFRSAAEIFARMRAYIDPGAMGRNWNDTTAMVIAGKAGVQFVGDWATAEFLQAQQVPDRDFRCVGSPGSNSTTIVADTLVFPKTGSAAQDRAQVLLATTILDPAVEARFSQKKGSIPARSDADAADLDGCAQKGLALMAAGRVAPDHTMVMTPDMVGTLGDVITEFWSDPRFTVNHFVDQFAETLRADD